MNWKNTWTLVGLAAALFAFIFFFERHLNPSGQVALPPPLFAKFKPTTAVTVQIRRGKDLSVTLERTNDAWRFSKPFAYPAAEFAVRNFLEALERTVPATHITAREILARKQTTADFGLDVPPVVITLEPGGQRLSLGARTPAGDQVYVEVGGQAGVFIIGTELLAKVPATTHDWRNPALFHLGDEKPDRVEIAHGGAPYVLQLDDANKLWRLTSPSHRADQLQVRQLLDKILLGRVVEFVTDAPGADLEQFGLAAPEYEVTLGSGPLLRKVQFGRAPTNNPGLVYARLLSHSNIVLVPKITVEPLAVPYAELRERQLAAFAPEFVDVIEVSGEEKFTVRRDASGAWRAGDTPADAAFIEWWLGEMSRLEATEFVRDVVTDFAPYGLAPGQRQYTLRTAVTNGVGVTNVLLAQLAFGTNAAGQTKFARRWDEDSVYAIHPLQFSHLPVAAWQFREHRLWNFTTSQVARITVQQDGGVREVIREPSNVWIGTKGWTTDPNPFALEETARGLGELAARMWMGRGEAARAQFGFDANSPQLTVQLHGEKPQLLTVEFGGTNALGLPYALTTVDGQPAVFEFPWTLYADLQRYFNLKAPARFRP